MGVVWVRRVAIEGSVDDGASNSFHSEYLVKWDAPTATREAVLLCGQVPVYGAPHPENPLSKCVKVTAKQNKDHPYLWNVSADWEYKPVSGHDPADLQKQPDLRRPRWRARFVPYPLARFFDLSDPAKLLADKAHTPFDPVPDIPIYVDEITIVRWEHECNRGTQRGYMGKSNEGVWLSAEPGTAVIDDISVDEAYEQGAYWFQTTYRVLVKPRIEISLPLGGTTEVGGYDPEYVCNMGPRALVLKDGKWAIRPVTHGGYYDGRPAFLKLDGTEIGVNQATGALIADPIFLEFTTKPRVDFGPLHLDPPPGWSGA
jgi:hypothetical protein